MLAGLDAEGGTSSLVIGAASEPLPTMIGMTAISADPFADATCRAGRGENTESGNNE